ASMAIVYSLISSKRPAISISQTYRRNRFSRSDRSKVLLCSTSWSARRFISSVHTGLSNLAFPTVDAIRGPLLVERYVRYSISDGTACEKAGHPRGKGRLAGPANKLRAGQVD